MRAASAATLDRGGDALLRAWTAMRAAALRLEGVRPLWIVAPLAVTQWLIALAIGLHAPHNGWLFYSGGDGGEYWTHEWALGHGYLPQTALGYGVPVFFAWVPRVFGPTPLTGAAPIMVVQVVVLGTIGLAAIYGIARRIAGRLFAAWAAALWVFVPVAVIPLWRSDYHYRYDGLFLPQALGIVNLGDYPSMIALLAVAYFAFRTIDEGRGNDALLTGLVAGLAIGIKPANALMVPVPVVAFAVARRWREVPLYAVALAPAVVTLTVWKARGLGHVPLLSAPELHEALGASLPVLPRVGHYLDFSRHTFTDNMGQIREFFWSRLLLEFLGVAGALAAIRRSPSKGVYLVAWFLAIVVVKGGNSGAAVVRTTSFFRLTMPGFPAYLLLVACVVLLVPGWGRHVRSLRVPGVLPMRTRGLLVGVALLAVLPLAVVAAARPAPREKLQKNLNTVIESPISGTLALTTERITDGVRLRWKAPNTNGAKVFYIIYRTGDGNGCFYDTRGAQECILQMDFLGRTGIRHLDDTPLPGRYTYRVAMAAAWTGQADEGDVILMSPPTSFEVRCTTENCKRDAKAYAAAHP